MFKLRFVSLSINKRVVVDDDDDDDDDDRKWPSVTRCMHSRVVANNFI